MNKKTARTNVGVSANALTVPRELTVALSVSAIRRSEWQSWESLQSGSDKFTKGTPNKEDAPQAEAYIYLK